MLAQLFLLMWIAHNGAQVIPGGSIKTVFFVLDEQEIRSVKINLSSMPGGS